MKYLLCIFFLLATVNCSVSAQGCKKSCATSTGCGGESKNSSAMINSGEVLACIGNCESDDSEYARARFIGKAEKGDEVEWITHSDPGEIGKRKNVRSVIQKFHAAQWKELAEGTIVIIGDGKTFKKVKIHSLDEKNKTVLIQLKKGGQSLTSAVSLPSILIPD